VGGARGGGGGRVGAGTEVELDRIAGGEVQRDERRRQHERHERHGGEEAAGETGGHRR